ncbi:MAG: hypothetical protein ACREX0_03760 [Noviherbaspirillum sp.]
MFIGLAACGALRAAAGAGMRIAVDDSGQYPSRAALVTGLNAIAIAESLEAGIALTYY